MRPRNNNSHLPGLQHRLHAQRKRHLRHILEIIPKKSSIRKYRIKREGLDSSSTGEGGPRLVERDIPVEPDVAEERVDAAGGFDGGFVCDAFGFEIRRVAVEDVDIAGMHVDVVEEVGVHEGVVGFGVFVGDANIFVL